MLYLLSNIVSDGTEMQIRKILDMGLLYCMEYILKMSDVSLLMSGMSLLDEVLNIGETKENGDPNELAVIWDEIGGVQLLEALQLHENEIIYNKSIAVMEKYYNIQPISIGGDTGGQPEINSNSTPVIDGILSRGNIHNNGGHLFDF